MLNFHREHAEDLLPGFLVLLAISNQNTGTLSPPSGPEEEQRLRKSIAPIKLL